MTVINKIDRFRGLAIALDLAPDKRYTLKSGVVEYVSISKFKRQLAPLFGKVGLDFKFNILDVTDIPTTYSVVGEKVSADGSVVKTFVTNNGRTRVKVEFILTDVENGDEDRSVLISDVGLDNIEKAIEIALSYSMRAYFTNRFMLVDGIECDEVGDLITEGTCMREIEPSPETATAPIVMEAPVRIPVRPKVEEVPKTVVAPAPKTIVVPKADTKVETVVKEPAGPEAPKEEPKAEAKAESKIPANISRVERIAVEKTMTNIEKRIAEGHVSDELYQKVTDLFTNLKTSADVEELMAINRDIEASIPNKDGM